MSTLFSVIAAGAVLIFLTALLPLFLLAVGFNWFAVPVFHLAPLDFWQAAGLFMLILGTKLVFFIGGNNEAAE